MFIINEKLKTKLMKTVFQKSSHCIIIIVVFSSSRPNNVLNQDGKGSWTNFTVLVTVFDACASVYHRLILNPNFSSPDDIFDAK